MGKKIKITIKLLMFLGVFACLAFAAYILISCYNRNHGFYLLKYATVYGGYEITPYAPSVGATWEAQGNDIYFSIQLAVYFGLGAVGFLLWGLPIYWLGCLFQRVEWIQLGMDAIKKQQGAKLND